MTGMSTVEWAVLNIAGWISLGVALEYFWMSQETLIILTIMLFLDRVFGVINAYIQWTLQSKLMVTWLVKKLTRWMLPFIVIAVMRWAWFEKIDLVSTCILSILIVAEWYSVIGHIYSINYGEELGEIDALKLLFQWIGRLFKWKLDDLSPKDGGEWNEKSDNTK